MRRRALLNRSIPLSLAVAIASLVASPAAHAVTYLKFEWEGQVAGFSIEGSFSYDETDIPADGVIRRANLRKFDVSFYDPQKNLLRKYVDNHQTYAGFNFNYDTTTQMILLDGGFSEPDGIDIGEFTAVASGGFTGLNFWSRPPASPVPHVHFDDWSDEFGFPRAFGGHEDVAFFDRTTQQLVDTGAVGPDYVDNPNFPLEAFGARMIVAPVPLPPALALLACGIGLIGWVARKT